MDGEGSMQSQPGGPPPPGPPPAPRPPLQPPQEPRAQEKTGGRKKIVLVMSIALVALLVIAGTIGGLYAWRFLKAAGALTVGDVDVSQVPDGTYSGSYDVFHVKASVEVRVEGGRITAIQLVDSGRMANETQQEVQEIFDEVLGEQSLDVDISSGASVSKKVSLKAVEEALGGD